MSFETEPTDETAAETPSETVPTDAPEPTVEASAGASAEAHASVDPGTSAYVVALQAELEEAKAKTEKAEKDFLYLQAEFQNYRRRKEEEFKSQQKFLSENLLRELLPIVDNFERAIAAAEQNQNFEKLIGGVNGTLKQIQTLLHKAGVTVIESIGKEFDPNFHEAIGHTEESEYPANTVAEEVQRGYVIHERVLRPALVKVAQ